MIHVFLCGVFQSSVVAGLHKNVNTKKETSSLMFLYFTNVFNSNSSEQESNSDLKRAKVAMYLDFSQANNGKPALNGNIVIRRNAIEYSAFILQALLLQQPCMKTEM